MACPGHENLASGSGVSNYESRRRPHVRHGTLPTFTALINLMGTRQNASAAMTKIVYPERHPSPAPRKLRQGRPKWRTPTTIVLHPSNSPSGRHRHHDHVPSTIFGHTPPLQSKSTATHGSLLGCLIPNGFRRRKSRFKSRTAATGATVPALPTATREKRPWPRRR